jgi:hypothetical protein
MAGVVSIRLEKKERDYLRDETRRRGNTYLSETIREMLGFPKATVRTMPIPLLDSIELDTPALATGFYEIVDRLDEMRRLLTRTATKVGVPREEAELASIGEAMRATPELSVVNANPKPIPVLPEGFAR